MNQDQIALLKVYLNAAEKEIQSAKKSLELLERGGRFEPQKGNVEYGAIAARRNLNIALRMMG